MLAFVLSMGKVNSSFRKNFGLDLMLKPAVECVNVAPLSWFDVS